MGSYGSYGLLCKGVSLGKRGGLLLLGLFALQCVQQLAKLIHGGLQIFHDILSQFFRGGQVVQVGQRFILDPENVQTGFVPGKNVLYRKAAPTTFGIFLAPGFLAFKAIFRIVALNKILQIGEGHGMLFEGKVHIGPQIIEPDFLGLAFRAGRTLIKEDHVRLYAGLVKDAGGKAKDGVEITGFQQLFPYGFTGTAFKKHVVRHDHRRFAGRLQQGIDVLDEIELFVGAGGPEVLPVIHQIFFLLLALLIGKGGADFLPKGGFIGFFA